MIWDLKKADFMKLSDEDKWRVVSTFQNYIYKLRAEINELEEAVSCAENEAIMYRDYEEIDSDLDLDELAEELDEEDDE